MCNVLLQSCPSWTPWNQWSSCSVTCDSGSRVRNRVCTNGIAGETGCPGPDQQDDICILGVSTPILLAITLLTSSEVFTFDIANKQKIILQTVLSILVCMEFMEHVQCHLL